jgi:imidazolonepropionase
MLIKNINILGQVLQEGENVHMRKGKGMMNFPCIKNAFLITESGKFADYGEMQNCPENYQGEVLDASGRIVLPAFVDSHTHIVFAKTREEEFTDKIRGLSYEEIARKGGGILNSAKKLRETSEDELYALAEKRLRLMIKMGTGAVEIKSGYGLSPEDELKMLRVIRRLKDNFDIVIKATFLGAHAFPREYSREEYMDLLLNVMIPQVAEEKLADYCDVFCDKGFFSYEETDLILEKAAKYGLKAKIHANELDYSGGIQAGVKHNAVSVDHLECTGDEEIEVLLNSNTVPTLLPGTAFFIRIPYPPARKMIDAGLGVAVASDFNPGSCPSGNMFFAVSLSCIQMRMMPEEALNAATINAAFAMELQDTHGVIAKGRDANFFITHEAPSLAYLPYSFGHQLADKVFIKGKLFS